MKNGVTTKIIIWFVIFAFVISFSPLSTIKTYAATSSISGLYSNPNTSNNTYKFKAKDVINSQLLTTVVGCTGVVNKVATWMMKMITSPYKTMKLLLSSKARVAAAKDQACAAVKAGIISAAGIVPFISDSTSGPKITFESWCKDNIKASDALAFQQAQQAQDKQDEQALRAQCFDGIAITLAKNQLTAMTRSMMNWVNSGFGGNPFFVRNMQNLMTNIENNVIETGIDILLSPDIENPYARDFARTKIAHQGIVSSSTSFLANMQSDLGAFISDPKSYYTNGQLGAAQDTRTALMRAQDAKNAFANDFASGGWNGWLALTQRDQNNPLGYIMTADQYFSDVESKVTTIQNNELTQNNGFLSQKVCDEWKVYDPTTGKPEYTSGGIPKTTGASGLSVTDQNVLAKPVQAVLSKKPPTGTWPAAGSCPPNAPDSCCNHFKNITPGSLIADKTKNYLTSPDRQAELVKTINDALNGLFSSLLSNFESGGLTGLSDQASNYSNWTDSLNNMSTLSSGAQDGSTPYDNNGAYNDFNITSDLGNTYYHITSTFLGNWNALNNVTSGDTNNSQAGQSLNSNTGPVRLDAKQNPLPTNYTYYNVTTAGNTILVKGGNNVWHVGDRAFWDGTAWQMWKCGSGAIVAATATCTNQLLPIKKRGVIQVQYDYIDAATQILQVLPSVMPKLGELDYCLPGPNPSYKANSTTADAQTAFQTWIDSSYIGPIDSTIDSAEQRIGVKIDGPGQRTYENFHEIFAKDNPGTWNYIKNDTYPTTQSFIQYIIDVFSWVQGINGGSYFYDPGQAQQPEIDNKTRLKNDISNYTSSSLFPNFFEVFDKLMNKMYYNNLTSEYIQNEMNPNSVPNTANYVPMAKDGYDLTKDILTYNDDNSSATKDYRDGITIANTNINKLKGILTQVSTIIQAAQARRETALEAQVAQFSSSAEATCANEFDACMNEYESSTICSPQRAQCISDFAANGQIMSVQDYLTKFAACFSDQTQEFYDTGILSNSSETGNNCNDGLDNDLDGLIDSQDPDCPGSGTTTVTQIQITFYFKLSSCADPTQFVQAQVTTTYPSNATQPTASSIFGPGARVQGGTNVYYTVVNSSTTSFGLQDIGTVIGTGASNCPSQIVTPPNGTTCTPPANYDQASNTCITCIAPAFYSAVAGACVNISNTTQTYTITGNVYNNTNGTVSPASQTVTNRINANGQMTYGSVGFTITPSTGHTIDPNGWSGNCIPTSVGVQNRYTVGGASQPITSDCNFTVTFQ